MDCKSVYNQIIQGVSNFFIDAGYRKAILGLSGGMDSSLTAVLLSESAVVENLKLIFMPTEFTSKISMENAYKLSTNLGIKLRKIDITPLFDKYIETLCDKEVIKNIGIPEENLQARIRGNILMWYGNREYALVIATGNRSEILTGYCTLYGDTVGALAPLGNLYKTEVYELAEWINKEMGEIIPSGVFEQEPSAELNKNQTDESDLYPYKILDTVLKSHYDEARSIEEIVSRESIDREIVKDIIKRVQSKKFKWNQLPPTLQINK